MRDIQFPFDNDREQSVRKKTKSGYASHITRKEQGKIIRRHTAKLESHFYNKYGDDLDPNIALSSFDDVMNELAEFEEQDNYKEQYINNYGKLRIN